jgi:large subunit ribosomal protein L24
MKLHIRKGDLVYVNAGKDKSKTGKVLQVFPAKQRAIVEGVNLVKHHSKPTNENPNGGIVEKEASIHISNLMLVDPETGKPTRIGRRLNADNKLVRYAKKSNKEIK